MTLLDKSYLVNLFTEDRQFYSFQPNYPGGYNGWSSSAKPLLSRLLGLENMVRELEKHQPIVQLKKTIQQNGYTCQAGYIETEPNICLPFWLLHPLNFCGPFPLAITPHEHDQNGHNSYAGVYHNSDHRQECLNMDRNVAIQAVQNGFLSIAPAIRGLSFASNYVPDIYSRHGSRDCRSHFMHAI